MSIDYLSAILEYPSSMQGVIDALSRTKTGKSVIDQLKASKNLHRINENNTGSGSEANATNKSAASNGTGCGSTIDMDTFNPNNSSPNGTGWNRPYELGVMHELQHSLDIDKGRLDKTENNGIENCEIDACRETNRVLKELQGLSLEDSILYGDYKPRSTYGGRQLPNSAVNPE